MKCFSTIYTYKRCLIHFYIVSEGYSVLLANCPAICSAIFVASCRFLYGAERSFNLYGQFLPILFIFIHQCLSEDHVLMNGI